MFRKVAYTLLVLLTALSLVACTGPAAPATPTPEPKLPNPASVYCVENGGTVVMRQDAAGGQSGVCVFPDKSECDEWAYFRGDCQPGDSLRPASPTPAGAAGIANPASAYCEGHGGTIEIRQDAAGGQSGVCVFSDQTQCEEWAYFRGECLPGTATP
jgi:putative hemolysin